MTTEITILNKQVAVLAADSAVSTSEKVFQSANKIFCLSKYHPVGVMIYAAASFMGIPWETIIKIYRKYLGDKSFPLLSDYAKDFLIFINSNYQILKNAISDKEYVRNISYAVASEIENLIKYEVKKRTDENGKIPEDEIKGIARNCFDKINRKINQFSILPNFSKAKYLEFSKEYKEEIKDIYNKYSSLLVGIKFTEFSKIVFRESISDSFILGYSGVVFAGYGEDEIYPGMIEYHVGGRIKSQLQSSKSQRQGCISPECPGYLAGFAQQDIIAMFMEGIHPDYKMFSEALYESLLDSLGPQIASAISEGQGGEEIAVEIKKVTNAAKENLQVRLAQRRRENYIQPVVDVISILPPAEVASLAEALVNITTIQRQISYDMATVGGPTDVAMITKGDGFIWVKRKHYFDAKLNHHFFANYFNGGYFHGPEEGNDDI